MSVKEKFEHIINNKNTRRQLVFGLAAVLWMTVIFCFSARPADLSEEDSGIITNLVAHIMHPGIDSWDLGLKEETLEKIDTAVRKTAHFAEYAILCVLFYGAFGGRMISCAFAAAAIYAVSDELHQLFVPGRAAKLTDVLIDAGGAAAAGIIIALLQLYRRRR